MKRRPGCDLLGYDDFGPCFLLDLVGRLLGRVFGRSGSASFARAKLDQNGDDQHDDLARCCFQGETIDECQPGENFVDVIIIGHAERDPWEKRFWD
jgi:hypothetical protein